MISKLLWPVVFGLIGATASYIIIPNNPITYPSVIVPARVIIEREPDTVRTFVDRIITVRANPQIIAIAPWGAQRQVQAFCKPLIVTSTDTVVVSPIVDPMLLLRSVSYDSRWAWRKDHLLVTGPVNNGDLKAIDLNVRGDWTLRTVGDGLLVQYPRTALIGDLWTGASQIYTLGSLIALLAGFVK